MKVGKFIPTKNPSRSHENEHHHVHYFMQERPQNVLGGSNNIKGPVQTFDITSCRIEMEDFLLFQNPSNTKEDYKNPANSGRSTKINRAYFIF